MDIVMCMAGEIGKIVVNKCLERSIFINTQKLQKLLVLMQIEHLERVKKELFSEKITSFNDNSGVIEVWVE